MYFLLKPIEQERLNDALDKALGQIALHLPPLYHVRSKTSPATLRVSSIKYVESNARKVRFHTATGEYEEYAKLDDVQKKLKGNFVRIHKSYLVNLNFVSQSKSNEVVMTDGTALPVSKSHTQNLRDALINAAKRV